MADKAPITSAYLRSRLTYDPQSGLLVWLPIPDTGHQSRAWNAKNAGRIAGSVTANGYIEVAFRVPDGTKFRAYAHRLAWLHGTGDWPSHQIDHIDGDKANNRIANLRQATPQQNTFNSRKPRRGNVSGVKGVSWDKSRQKWFAAITVDAKMIPLGRFKRKADAIEAYAAAARKYHGEFAGLPDTD